MKIISWNVNGLRAVHRKELFLPWLKKTKAEIICLQETKAHEEQLSDDLINIKGYHSFFSKPERKGYSGVALYTKEKPEKLITGFGNPKYDVEGRVIQAHYDKFILFNVYFPNGGMGPHRLKFKMDFYYDFLNYLNVLLKKKKRIIICGDVNTAHKEIDLARPKANEKNTGFLPEERKWIDDLIDAGFVDTFRIFNDKPDNYSYWDMKTRARERNVGWRIDYFFVSNNLSNKIKNAFILNKVMGSDHCPVGIEIIK